MSSQKSQGRQRQHLIEACISALHRYGPSRTTVEKVVAIAKMSPGIVRFYFDSKGAMLVASLQFLAAEFEDRVMAPVARLKATPVAALDLLVDLYLDPDIASPRKVSVWYAFWGEASSRQEYYDICGQKDEGFAALVRELVDRVIEQGGLAQLDADGVALAIIGALEILWQDIAFQSERNIDRTVAKARCRALLASVFPGCFAGPERVQAPASLRTARSAAPAGWAYASLPLLAEERATLFSGAWTFAGDSSVPQHAGEFRAIDLGAERALLVRDACGVLHALRDSCPAAPHSLVALRQGRFADGIECRIHSLRFALDGREAVEAGAGLPGAGLPGAGLPGAGGLEALSMWVSPGGSILLRAASPAGIGAARERMDFWRRALPAGGVPLGSPQEKAVGADWKIVVELWLALLGEGAVATRSGDIVDWTHGAAAGPEDSVAGAGEVVVRADPGVAGADHSVVGWRHRFLFPNHVLERRADGWSVLQALPVAPGRCVMRRFDYSNAPNLRSARAAAYLASRRHPFLRRSSIALAQSTQRGFANYDYRIAAATAKPWPVTWFREQLVARLPILCNPLAPRSEHDL